MAVEETTPVRVNSTEEKDVPFVVAVTSNIYSELGDAFKWIPGKEQKRFPRSEHLYDILSAPLQEILFLGKNYEQLFDEFEVYTALTYSYLLERDWAPIGRFGWKHARYEASSPFTQILEKAKKEQMDWGPIKAGMFGGSIDEFIKISESIRQFINKLSLW